MFKQPILQHEVMSFLRVKKRRITFNVELLVVSLSDVPLLNAVIFAKVRLMECGTFESYTRHQPVIGYQVDFVAKSSENAGDATSELEDGEPPSSEDPQPFQFQCRIPFDEKTGELEECRCKISLRKEDKTGRAPQKLGFVVLNLSEFAASGTDGITQSFLLDGYSGGQRQDNSRVQCHIRMNHQAQDPLFKVPTASLSAVEEEHLNPADRKAPSSATNTISRAGVLPTTQNAHSTSLYDNSSKSNGEPTPDTAHRHNSLASIIHSRFGSDHQHEDNRPTSCTNFGPSSSYTFNASASGGADRSSWHAGPSTYNTCASIPSSSSEPSSQHPFSAAGVALRGELLPSSSVIPSNLNPAVPHHHSARRMSEERLALSGFAGGTGPTNASLANRVQKTRRDAEDVIEEVLAETSALMDTSLSDTEEMPNASEKLGPGLALFISKDGNSTALGSENAGEKDPGGQMSINSSLHESENSGPSGGDALPFMSKRGFERVILNEPSLR